MSNISNKEQSNWPVLKSPPVILAIFQLKFVSSSNEDLIKLTANDKAIRLKFINRNENYHYNIGVQGTPVPGISMKAKADTKVNSFIYSTSDQKKKFIIDKESLTYVDENLYTGWSNFKQDVLESLNLLSEELKNTLVTRISIRFVNKFSFESFSNSLEYFTKTISTESDVRYPLLKSAFRLEIQIPKTDIVAIVNHALEPNSPNNLDYFFDIDVLDYKQLKFDLSLISSQMEQARAVKNDIFFDTVKQKTIDLCN